jgi:hypothetical protein
MGKGRLDNRGDGRRRRGILEKHTLLRYVLCYHTCPAKLRAYPSTLRSHHRERRGLGRD